MKNVNIDYKGSFVKTTKRIANLILVLGLISTVVVAINGLAVKNYNVIGLVVALFLSTLFVYVLLRALSIILKHILYMRSYVETKALKEDIVITKKED